MSESKMSDMISAALGNIRNAADANTIIGDPISTPSGTVILPVSKVSVGVATGGLDFNSKTENQKSPKNFGGGGGTGMSVVPVAFLCIKEDGSVELLNISDPTDKNDPVNTIMSLVNKSPDIIGKVKSLFGKKKKDKDAEEEVEIEIAEVPEE